MFSKSMMGWGAVLVGVLIAATTFLEWNTNLNYLWSLLVLIWGFAAFKG